MFLDTTSEANWYIHLEQFEHCKHQKKVLDNTNTIWMILKTGLVLPCLNLQLAKNTYTNHFIST